jgi:hypothetical protein
MPDYHGKAHLPKQFGGTDPIDIPPPYHVKVFGDTRIVLVGDARWIITMPHDMHQLRVWDIEISVTTVSSSGIVQVQLRNIDNGNVDILSTRAQIDVGDYHSDDSGTQPVVNGSNNLVSHKDKIAMDIDAAGTGAKGLEVVVFWGPG